MRRLRPSLRASASFIAIAAAIAIPASSAPPSGPETQVWIDVSTHNMAGMPDMGGLGRFGMGMMGGKGAELTYPSARYAAMTGQYLDIALHNSLKPGVEAMDAVPSGLKLGKSLPLVPPTPQPAARGEPGAPGQLPEGQITVLEYWGCGAAVRPGQPKKLTVQSKGGSIAASGGISAGKYAPDRDIDATPAYAVWPNRKNGKRVPDGASLAGAHQISGDGVPASLKFELDRNADFMPKIALSTKGQASDAITVGWQPVDRARAYFLTAFAMQDKNTMVLWSSAETGGAGQGLMQYLTGSYIDRWLKEKVLLAPSATSCTIPKGIFAASGNAPAEGGMGGMGMLGMIAYGPETNLVWPPKPADPKEALKWDPEWNVRVRTKSTASAMLGMDLSGVQVDRDSDSTDQKQEQESKGKKLLKGILRNF